MSEQTVDGVTGFTDQEGRRHTVVFEATTDGQQDNHGRQKWRYNVKSYEQELGADQYTGEVWHKVQWSYFSLMSQILGSVNMKIIQRDADEAAERAKYNND